MSNNFFDESVREKLDGHEAPVPADAWANIQKGKKKRRPLPFFWLLAGLLLCGGGGLYLYKTGPSNENEGANHFQKSGKAIADSNDLAVAGRQENNSSKENSNADKIKTGKHDLIPGAYDVKKDPPASMQKYFTNDNNPANQDLPVSDNNTTDKSHLFNAHNRTKNNASQTSMSISLNDKSVNADDPFNRTRKTISNRGKVKMQVSAPGETEDDVNGMATGEKNDEVHTDSSGTLSKKEKDKTVLTQKNIDTARPVSNNNIVTKEPSKKKRNSAGLLIDLGFNGFVPAANKTAISLVNRTTVTPLSKAEFEATSVRISLQPAAGFNLSLFKSLSPKVYLGAGLGFQSIKEYIHLSGEETNTRYTVVKRLNGNSLVDDTVTTVSKGIRTIDAVNSYTFWSIPVSIRYRLLQQSHLTMDLQAGIDFNLQSSYKNSIGGTLVPQFAGANNTKRNTGIGTGFNAGIRMSRKVGKNYFLYAAPYIQFNPRSFYLQEMLAPARLHRAGMSVGITYGFK